MRIVIETVPHSQQPYPTCGYWTTLSDGSVRIAVSETGNDDYNFLVALHELYEQKLCAKRGIKERDVDAFDIEFEAKRAKALVLSNAEPGDDKNAPYQREHCEATGIERIAAAALGVKWSEYETVINSL